jgi:hypothetical protein
MLQAELEQRHATDSARRLWRGRVAKGLGCNFISYEGLFVISHCTSVFFTANKKKLVAAD